jgi:hypothetical protein
VLLVHVKAGKQVVRGRADALEGFNVALAVRLEKFVELA